MIVIGGHIDSWDPAQAPLTMRLGLPSPQRRPKLVAARPIAAPYGW
jgi:hypothetical protein